MPPKLKSKERPQEQVHTGAAGEIIRHQEVDPEFLTSGPWDGRNFSYIPPAELDIDPSLELHEDFDLEIDPVTYQVLRSRFWNLNLDHSDTLKRVSGTPVIVYMEDFNTSLLTENGDTVVCGPSIQYFTGYGDLVVKWTLEHRSRNPGIEDGDVFLQNDPYIGTAHQMDTQLYAPLFWEGRLFCWIFGNCHVGDIGGTNPGSFCPEAPDIFHEPELVPPMRIVRSGVVQQDVFDMFVRKSRTPEGLALQLRSQIAGINVTRARLLELLKEYDARIIKGAMRRMIVDCYHAVGERLERLPDGLWEEAIHIGCAGPNDRDVHRLTTSVRKVGDRMIFSNAGTDPQFYAANGTYGSWRSALLCAASTMLAYDQMYCPAGVLAHMQFEPVPGTLNCASYPAAVTTLSATIVSVYLASQVLSKMLMTGPEDLRNVANATGGVALPGWWVASGLNRNGKFVADVTGDQVMGAIGAFPFRDGVDTGGAWWWPRSTAGNVEDWEQSLPFLYLYRREQMDSGGPGQWRGGNGVELAIIPHKTEALGAQVISVDPGVITTLGLAGGHPGHPGNFLRGSDTPIRRLLAEGVLPGTRRELEETIGELRRQPPKITVTLSPDDVWMVENSAGGGYGDPLLRPPELVSEDVKLQRISVRAASHHYGVVLGPDGEVDENRTEALRLEHRMRRFKLAGVSTSLLKPVARDRSPEMNDEVGLTRQNGETYWACGHCAALLGSAAENYKYAAALIDRNPHEVDSVMYADPGDFCDVEIVLRQHICPSCAHLLSTEVCRKGDPPLWERRLIEETNAQR